MAELAQPGVGGRIGRALGRLLGGLLLAVMLILGGTAIAVWSVARDTDTRPADALVVLGAAQYDGVPSQWFAARLDRAAELYRSGVAPRIITVGGKQDGDTYTEAAAGQNYLIAAGIDPAAIIAVEEGTDTLLSIHAVAATMAGQGWDSAVLVTDPEHSLRSRVMAEDVGIAAWTAPTRSGPAVWDRATQLHSLARETAGLVYYQLTHASSDALERAATAARAADAPLSN